jgi:hypothetical protein
VSTCYLKRFLSELTEVIEALTGSSASLSESVATWLNETREAYAHIAASLSAADITDATRRSYLDRVALPYEAHRARAYSRRLGGRVSVSHDALLTLCASAITVCEWTLKRARRVDGLYDAYRLMRRHPDGGLGVTALPLMLEGQVALLSSGVLDPSEAADLVDALFTSGLYRADQKSFTLMVPVARPGFMAVNAVDVSPLIAETLSRATSWGVLRQDDSGTWRFHPELSSHRDLAERLDGHHASEAERTALATAYEATFEHHRFLGRSGAMYSYEGIGCIYWHMVAKLLLAVGECATEAESDRTSRSRLVGLYQRVRDGLGFRRSAKSYGAFPADPYSHTPAHRGAQQPGMTGLVKEDLLTRYLELGVALHGGQLSFAPQLLQTSEFIAQAGSFKGHARPAHALAFTLAGVPVIYVLGDSARIQLIAQDETERTIEGPSLDVEASARWLGREGGPRVVYVTVNRDALN